MWNIFLRAMDDETTNFPNALLAFLSFVYSTLEFGGL